VEGTRRVEDVIADVLAIPADRVTDDLCFQSIRQWDSLGHVELMLALEEAWGIEIDSDLTLRLTTVQAIRDEARLRAAASANGSRPAVAPSTNGAKSSNGHLRRGLNGVVFERTRIAAIDGTAGALLIRGYSIHDLARRSTFEETTYLLLHGDLPAARELAQFDDELRAARPVPDQVLGLLDGLRDAHPLDALRTAVSALAPLDPERHDASREAALRKGVRLIAQLPTLVAAHHALRSGREPTPPEPTLSHAANALQMLGGAWSPSAASVVDRDLVIHAEHGSNASAFAARVACGTGADVYSAVVAALATFGGPLHGGAVQHVMQMVREIGDPADATTYVRDRRLRGEPLMGFGHRVYRTEDPRARHFREAARRLSTELGDDEPLRVLEALVREMRRHARHGLDVNVDLYAGLVYHLLGLPDDLFVPMFALGRISGWIAHVLEQLENNILIRPLLHYDGHPERAYLAVEHR
jgi:citrate synthase